MILSYILRKTSLLIAEEIFKEIFGMTREDEPKRNILPS
jgi:hypothetical protein